MKKIILSTIIMLGSLFSVSAQIYWSPNNVYGTGYSRSGRVQKVEGDVNKLRDVKEINLVFDYDDMAVGKFEKEEEYVNKKVSEYNKKKAGRGDEWKKSWIDSRKNRYEPKFTELFNKYGKNIGMMAKQNNENAPHTLIVKTRFTEPGFNIGLAKMPASLDLEYIFQDKDGNVLARYAQGNIAGQQAMGFDFDVGTRVAEGYAKGGKSLGKYIIKQFK